MLLPNPPGRQEPEAPVQARKAADIDDTHLTDNMGITSWRKPPPTTRRLRISDISNLHDGQVYIGPGARAKGLKCSDWSYQHRPLENETEAQYQARYKDCLYSQPDLMDKLGELRGKDLV